MKKNSKNKKNSKKVTKLVIDRKRWMRTTPGDPEQTGLLFDDSTKKMCCLGFYCRSLGLSIDKIRNVGTPEELCWYGDKDVPWQMENSWLLNEKGRDSADTNKLVNINDNARITDKEKETSIKKIFAKHDVKVTFK